MEADSARGEHMKVGRRLWKMLTTEVRGVLRRCV